MAVRIARVCSSHGRDAHAQREPERANICISSCLRCSLLNSGSLVTRETPIHRPGTDDRATAAAKPQKDYRCCCCTGRNRATALPDMRKTRARDTHSKAC